MNYEIVDYGCLSENQKKQAVELFMDGFGHFTTFSKDGELKRNLLGEIFHPTLFKCYVAGDDVLGMIGLATNKVRPLNFDFDTCVKYFGEFKGRILSRQMNAIFQKQVVKSKEELYIDVLVTGRDAQRKGIGTALLNYAFGLEEYNTYSIEVLSNNRAAIKLYEKIGFVVEKREKLSLIRLLGVGYPIIMKYMVA